MRNVTETVKQLVIINVFLFLLEPLVSGDVAYKCNSIFPENPGFECLANNYTCFAWRVYAYFL
jgi:hypothetical protein